MTIKTYIIYKQFFLQLKLENRRILGMRFMILYIFLILNINGLAQTELQRFNIISKHDDIEIRNYEPAIYASVTLPTNTNEQSSSFRILAGYIFGGNEENQKIAMTAPVHMHRNDINGDKSLTMRFVMPDKYSIEDLSKPNDSRIEITKSEEKKFAAISFTGYNNDSKFLLKSNKLKKFLDSKNISYVDNPIYLGYDPPYKCWNRRNEVLFELSN